MNLKNAEKEKLRQNILMKMPAMDKKYYECYYSLLNQQDNVRGRNSWFYLLFILVLLRVLVVVEILCNPTNDDLVNAIHYNFRNYFLNHREYLNAEWFEEPDITYLCSDNPLYRGVEMTKFTPMNADQRINEIKSLYASNGKSFHWDIAPSDTPSDLDQRLDKAGLKRTEYRGMALIIKDLKMPMCPEGFTVKKCKGVREKDAWARLLADAYPLEPEPWVESTHDYSRCKEVTCYVGLLNGRPVATGSMYLSAGVAGLNAIATLPNMRGRGIGSYITAASLLEAQDKGYEVSTLIATEMGYSVYLRLGYRELCKKLRYSWSPPQASV